MWGLMESPFNCYVLEFYDGYAETASVGSYRVQAFRKKPFKNWEHCLSDFCKYHLLRYASRFDYRYPSVLDVERMLRKDGVYEFFGFWGTLEGFGEGNKAKIQKLRDKGFDKTEEILPGLYLDYIVNFDDEEVVWRVRLAESGLEINLDALEGILVKHKVIYPRKPVFVLEDFVEWTSALLSQNLQDYPWRDSHVLPFVQDVNSGLEKKIDCCIWDQEYDHCKLSMILDMHKKGKWNVMAKEFDEEGFELITDYVCVYTLSEDNMRSIFWNAKKVKNINEGFVERALNGSCVFSLPTKRLKKVAERIGLL